MQVAVLLATEQRFHESQQLWGQQSEWLICDIVTTMDSDNFVLLPDQTYHHIDYHQDDEEYSDSEDDSEEYLKEMEIILRKIRRKKYKHTGNKLKLGLDWVDLSLSLG